MLIDPKTLKQLLLWSALSYILLFVMIVTNGGELVHHKRYSLDYEEKYEIANWVSYRIKADQLTGKVERESYFPKDPKVSTGSASTSDYTSTGFDRGHMAPASIFQNDEDAMRESFYMSNITPQVPGFNRGIWKQVETSIQDSLFWMMDNVDYKGDLKVITGSVVIGQPERIGKSEVAVPQLFYKLVYTDQNEFLFALVLPNKKVEDFEPANFLVPLEFVKALTGIKSFKDKLPK